MNCPKCRNNDIDEAGKCRVCGFLLAGRKVLPEPLAQKAEGGPPGMIEMHCHAPGESDGADLPPWRQELSKRLLEIRQKRELSGAGGMQSPPAATPIGAAVESKQTLPSPPANPPLPREPAPKLVLKHSPRTEPRSKPRVVKEPVESLPLFQPLQAKPEKAVPAEDAKPENVTVKPQSPAPEISNLIDSVLSARTRQPQAAEPVAEVRAAQGTKVASKLILVSRTLAGLVDLIIIILCTGAFILAADGAAGIDIVDRFTLIIFALTLLAVYFLYSIFFLCSANQTIGMMFTDLRLVDSVEQRPKLQNVLLRCLAYPPFFLLAGIGLIWGVIDSKNRCLHDLLSGTRVVRIP